MSGYKNIFLVVSVTILIAPLVSTAQIDYVPLVGIPGLGNDLSAEGYVNTFYRIAIAVAAFLAVGQIIIAGVKYMLTDVVTAKGDAKRHIRGALLGLVIVLSSALILQTINPELTNLEFLRNSEKINASAEGGFEIVGPTPIGERSPEEVTTYCASRGQTMQVVTLGGVQNYVCAGNTTDTNFSPSNPPTITSYTNQLEVLNYLSSITGTQIPGGHVENIGNTASLSTQQAINEIQAAISVCNTIHGGNTYHLYSINNQIGFLCLNN